MLGRIASQCVTYCTEAPVSRAVVKSMTCWKCSKDINLPEGRPVFFCPCDYKVVLPPSTLSYFVVMDSSMVFKIDLGKLKNTYRQLQKLLHPDRFAQKSKEEQQYSAEQSALVNRAYNTLNNPYSRGVYLLGLSDVTIDEMDNSADNQTMLEEVMELSEEIHHGNPSQFRLREIWQLNAKKLSNLVNKTDEYFQKGDLAGAKATLGEMKYLVNIHDELSKKLDIQD